MRLLYQAFVNHFQQSKSINNDNESIQSTNEISNQEFVDYKLRLRVNYIYANEISKVMLEEFNKWETDEDPPSVIIVSCTYSKFKNGNITREIEKAFMKNLTMLIKPIDRLIAKKSKVLWKLQDPVDEAKTVSEWKNVLNVDIEKFNRAVWSILRYSDVNIWSSSRQLASGLIDEMVDGFKLGPIALKYDIQLLLNMYCNDNMNYNDGTCCSSSESYTMLQIVTYAVLGVW